MSRYRLVVFAVQMRLHLREAVSSPKLNGKRQTHQFTNKVIWYRCKFSSMYKNIIENDLASFFFLLQQFNMAQIQHDHV